MRTNLTHYIPLIISSTNQVEFALQKINIKKDKHLVNEWTGIQMMVQHISVEDQLKGGALVTANLKPIVHTMVVYNYYAEEKVTEEVFNEWVKKNNRSTGPVLKKLE